MKSITVQPTEAYELIDSGNGLRLERFGQHTIVRPDPSVLWKPTTANHPAWINPDATFVDTEKERWRLRKPQLANGWEISFDGGAKVLVKPTPFRHVGIFPEQEANWTWIRNKIKKADKPKVLNLFGYTGVASIIAAQAGALVTHVDSSKSTVFWASDNAKRSGLGEKGIRWMVDDVQKFVKRELRRGAKYDLIIMDPPVFGRGAKGEIWRLEEDLGPLLAEVAELLSDNALGFVLNFYATTLYPEAVARLTDQALAGRGGDLGLYSLCLGESESGKALPTGYCVRSE